MATTYFLAPNARWQGRDQTGEPVIGGKLYTYEAGTTTPKATYQDKDGISPNTNPVILDGKGEANIYWADDNLYKIALYTATDDLVYTQDNYPWVANDQNDSPTNFDFTHNLIRNPQFTFWSNTSDFPNIKTAQTNYDYCADDWLYKKTCADSVVEIKRNTFNLGQVEVEGTPEYYISYECTNIGSGTETYSRLYQRYNSVQTLQQQNVQCFIWARCRNMPSSTLNVRLVQDFGTGGSPSASVPTTLLSLNLTNAWQKFELADAVQLPSVSSKTLGTDGNDALLFEYVFPNNQVAYIDISTSQLTPSVQPQDFDYLSINDQYKRLDRTITEATFATGDVKLTIRAAADPGWLMMNDGTIGNVGSGATTSALYTKALYELIWDNIGDPAWTPIYDSSGVLTTFGSTADADWTAGKRLSLTKALGRTLAGAGQGTLDQTVTFLGAPTNQVVFNASGEANSFLTGTAITFTTTGTLPTGLTPGATYYAIYVGPQNITLATSLVNALANPPVAMSFTGSGTGVHTIHLTFSSWALGEYYGEENHPLTVPETPAHTHPAAAGSFITDDAGNVYSGGGGLGHAYGSTGLSGGSQPHNTIPPTTFMNVMIKL